MVDQEDRKEKDGGMVLLEERHFHKNNPWQKPVVGWTPTSQGVGGAAKPSWLGIPACCPVEAARR